MDLPDCLGYLCNHIIRADDVFGITKVAATQVVVARVIGVGRRADVPTTAIEPGLSNEARSAVGGTVDSGMSARSVAEGWGRGKRNLGTTP